MAITSDYSRRNIIDDFDADLKFPVIESALDDTNDSDVYDKTFSELDKDYNKCMLTIDISMRYQQIQNVYRKHLPDIEDAIKTAIKRMGISVTRIIKHSFIFDEDDDVIGIVIMQGDNINSAVDIRDVDGVYKILSTSASCMIRITGKTEIYKNINERSVKSGINDIVHDIAGAVAKTGVRDVSWFMEKFEFSKTTAFMRRQMENDPSDVFSIIPDEDFYDMDFVSKRIHNGYNMRTGQTFDRNVGNILILDQSGDTNPVTMDMLLSGGNDTGFTARMEMCTLIDDTVYLTWRHGECRMHVDVKRKDDGRLQADIFRHKNNARDINKIVRYMNEHLDEFIKEHKEEIKYRSVMEIDNSNDEINSISYECVTNIMVSVSGLDFVICGIISTTLNPKNPKKEGETVVNYVYSNKDVDKIKKFVKTVLETKYTNEEALIDLVNANTGLELKPTKKPAKKPATKKSKKE